MDYSIGNSVVSDAQIYKKHPKFRMFFCRVFVVLCAEGLLREPVAAGCSRANRPLRLLILLCSRVGVGFLLHAGCPFFAVGV